MGVIAAGGGLIEAGQLLRQSSVSATAVYANPQELHQTGEKVQVACS
jgi:hypothetical protein